MIQYFVVHLMHYKILNYVTEFTLDFILGNEFKVVEAAKENGMLTMDTHLFIYVRHYYFIFYQTFSFTVLIRTIIIIFIIIILFYFLFLTMVNQWSRPLSG